MLQIAHMAPDVTGRMTSIYKSKFVCTQHVRMPDKVI